MNDRQKIIRVGLTGDYPPFSFYDSAAKKYVGFDVAMSAALAAHTGSTIEFIHTTWPDLENDLQANLFDIAMGGISITAQRAKKFLFSLPIIADGKTPLIHRKNSARFKNLADIDIAGVKVIANPGGTNEQFVRTYIHQATVIIHADMEAIFKKLESGAADVMFTDRLEALYRQAAYSALYAVNTAVALTSTQLAYMFGAQGAALKKTVDEWLRCMHATGKTRELFQQFFPFCLPNLLIPPQ
jgi:cyclohexadienyl dehydratase